MASSKRLNLAKFRSSLLISESKPVKPIVTPKPDVEVKPAKPDKPAEPVKPKKPAGAVSMFGGVDLLGASKSPPSSAAAAKAHVTAKPKG